MPTGILCYHTWRWWRLNEIKWIPISVKAENNFPTFEKGSWAFLRRWNVGQGVIDHGRPTCPVTVCCCQTTVPHHFERRAVGTDNHSGFCVPWFRTLFAGGTGIILCMRQVNERRRYMYILTSFNGEILFENPLCIIRIYRGMVPVEDIRGWPYLSLSGKFRILETQNNAMCFWFWNKTHI